MKNNDSVKKFVNRFSTTTLNALKRIVRGNHSTTASGVRRDAAYRANLTRGTYSGFLEVKKGRVTVNRIGAVVTKKFTDTLR